jgi:hypothetical protein
MIIHIELLNSSQATTTIEKQMIATNNPTTKLTKVIFHLISVVRVNNTKHKSQIQSDNQLIVVLVIE